MPQDLVNSLLNIRSSGRADHKCEMSLLALPFFITIGKNSYVFRPVSNYGMLRTKGLGCMHGAQTD
jgi:hypothetical protein